MAFKVHGVPWSRYMDEARKRGVGNRCYNCLGSSHTAQECRLKCCKFCLKETAAAGHYSILCKKAPWSFEKYLEARRDHKAKSESARYAEDFMDYEFSSDELSD